jgi:hypothetical protein
MRRLTLHHSVLSRFAADYAEYAARSLFKDLIEPVQVCRTHTASNRSPRIESTNRAEREPSPV